MLQCGGVRKPTIEYIPILSDYNKRKSAIEMSETIYNWMKMNLDNEFVQKLGKIWLKQIMRLK
jgi:hypothetical protein